MHVNSTVKMNMPRIRKLTNAAVIALEMTAEALHTEVIQAQVMPFDTGHMQDECFAPDYQNSSTGKVQLVTSTPYARRLYYHPEYNFKTDKNPNAKGHWYKDWEPGGSKEDFAPKAFKKFYKRVGGV